ncbi:MULTISPECIES: hypothetical protein [Coriobacteriia]|uniref:hypothetical protein n=1 Tax=Coriobacteriia TaxID=84998 RepID=UPI0023F474E2|nr:hypothetical protein [Parvibacter caecicola]
MNFNLAVVDRTTAFIGDNRAVEHCVRGDTIEVEFDTEWNDVENKVAVFVNRADGTRKTVVMRDDPIVIPWEVLRTDGEMYVTFIGYIGDLTENGIRLVTKLMDKPFTVQRAEIIDVLVPEATEDVLHLILGAVPLINDARDKALSAAARADAAADLIGSSAVTRTEFSNAIDELAAVLANYMGRIWYLNKILYVPSELTEIDIDTLRVSGAYDPDTKTLWIGETDA